jgi:hypothetical protein
MERHHTRPMPRQGWQVQVAKITTVKDMKINYISIKKKSILLDQARTYTVNII